MRCGEEELFIKYSNRWASAAKQAGSKVLMPFGEVFQFDLNLAISLRVSSISARVGDSIIQLPSASELQVNSNIPFISQVSKGTIFLSTSTR